ncbi:MAG: hypothetical protein ABI035_00895, partial [Gemmatimonadaceae bacterium]
MRQQQGAYLLDARLHLKVVRETVLENRPGRRFVLTAATLQFSERFQIGEESVFLYDPMRVLSLLPAATEIVCALGAGGSLVGITHECDFPGDVVGTLPRVTRSTLDEAVNLPGDIDRAVRAQAESGQPLYTLD